MPKHSCQSNVESNRYLKSVFNRHHTFRSWACSYHEHVRWAVGTKGYHYFYHESKPDEPIWFCTLLFNEMKCHVSCQEQRSWSLSLDLQRQENWTRLLIFAMSEYQHSNLYCAGAQSRNVVDEKRWRSVAGRSTDLSLCRWKFELDRLWTDSSGGSQHFS